MCIRDRCFGAEVSEFKVAGEYFTLVEELPAHLWRGILVPASDETMMTDGGDVAAVDVYKRQGFVPRFERDRTPQSGGDIARRQVPAVLVPAFSNVSSILLSYL